MGVVVLHGVEPLDRDAVEPWVIVARIGVEGSRELLVAEHIAAALKADGERAVDLLPVLVELGGGETGLAANKDNFAG